MPYPSELVEHTFFDESTQKFHTFFVTREMQQKITSDNEFACEILDALKNLEKEESKENEDINERSVEQRGPSDDEPHEAKNSNKGNDAVKKQGLSKTDTVKPKGNGLYTWKFDDTNALIQSYGSHMEELDHPIQRKFFWNNVANDLVSQKFNVDKQMCYNKWNNLLRTYRNCKDKTGRGATRFLFATQMDEIIGDRPIHSSSYTLSSMEKKIDQNSHKVKSSDLCDQDTSSHGSEESHCPSEQLNTKKCNKRKGCKENKKRTKKQRADEKLEIQRLRLQVEQKKLALEERKCNLVEEFLKLKNQK